jgi:hypothetical protein
MPEFSGQVMLRKEFIDGVVKGFALQEYVMKQLVINDTSSSWKESYFQETSADLTSPATNGIRGIPRLAAFPVGRVTESKQTATQEKYGMEDTISYEDEITNAVDVISRTLLRISRAVVRAVDTQIWNVLTESQSPTNINSVTIAAGNEWDSATIANRDPIQNILDAIRAIQEDNYNALNGNGHLVLNPKDFANLMGNANVRNAGQFYTSDVTQNGRVGRLLGLTVVVSNTVTADYAAVIIAKECGTWKSALGLTVESKKESGISTTIRAFEIGVCQLTNPNAVCLITNTAA